MLTFKHPDFADSNREDAEVFVSKQQALGNAVWWEGWDMVFFRPDHRGLRDAENGMFHNGQWGFRNVSPLKDDGTWEVDHRNVRRRKRTTRT